MKPKYLQKLNDVSVVIAKSLFSQELESQKKSKECSLPPFENFYTVHVGLGSANFQGQIVFGFTNQVAKNLLKKVLERLKLDDSINLNDLVCSALGEYLNVTSAEIVEFSDLSEEYEKLHISPPVVWSKEGNSRPHFLKGDGRAGSLKIGDHEINTYISLKPMKKNRIEGMAYKLSKDDLSEFDQSEG